MRVAPFFLKFSLGNLQITLKSLRNHLIDGTNTGVTIICINGRSNPSFSVLLKLLNQRRANISIWISEVWQHLRTCRNSLSFCSQKQVMSQKRMAANLLDGIVLCFVFCYLCFVVVFCARLFVCFAKAKRSNKSPLFVCYLMKWNEIGWRKWRGWMQLVFFFFSVWKFNKSSNAFIEKRVVHRLKKYWEEAIIQEGNLFVVLLQRKVTNKKKSCCFLFLDSLQSLKCPFILIFIVGPLFSSFLCYSRAGFRLWGTRNLLKLFSEEKENKSPTHTFTDWACTFKSLNQRKW